METRREKTKGVTILLRCGDGREVAVPADLLSPSPFYGALAGEITGGGDAGGAEGGCETAAGAPLDAPADVGSAAVADLFAVLARARDRTVAKSMGRAGADPFADNDTRDAGDEFLDPPCVTAEVHALVGAAGGGGGGEEAAASGNEQQRRDGADWLRAMSLMRAADAFGMDRVLEAAGRAVAKLLADVQDPAQILADAGCPGEITSAEHDAFASEFPWI
jgi:hypothetical protein